MTARSDEYTDTGCFISKSCLACPRSICIEDVGVMQAKTLERDAEKANAVAEAEKTMPRFKAIKKVANDFGVSTRTVNRVLARI